MSGQWWLRWFVQSGVGCVETANTPPSPISDGVGQFQRSVQGPGETWRHVWHVHLDTDEFFLVLQGPVDIALRDDAGVEAIVDIPDHVDSTTGHPLRPRD
jgi:mannose-6-phosphate isomerase-like protein (cupin superfamily)